MKKYIALTIVTLALAGLCCVVSLITVRTAAPALLTSHAIALAVGVVLLAVMVAMGPTRLSKDEIAYAKRNKRFCRLVIEKETTINNP